MKKASKKAEKDRRKAKKAAEKSVEAVEKDGAETNPAAGDAVDEVTEGVRQVGLPTS